MGYNFLVCYVLGVVVFVGGLATSAGAASFDCTKAATAVEKMICGNEGLSKLDEVMADTYKAQLAARPNDPSIRNDQATWLQERNKCTSDSCLVVAYLDRLKALEQRGQPATQSPASTDADLLKEVEVLNGKCRGGSGDSPATMAACKERDAVVSSLHERGWCWGKPEDQYEYQKSWQRCRGAGTAAASTPLAKCMAAIEQYQRAFAMSYAAKICSLRGDRYMSVFDNARHAVVSGPACRGVSNKDMDADMARLFINEVGKIGMRNGDSSSWDQACRRLAASPDILRELDATYRQLTLGYR